MIKNKFGISFWDKKIFALFLLFLVFLANSWSIFRTGLGSGHDFNHDARIYEMAEGLKEGNFPVIWSSNFNFGYGMPLFEFYAPLPYFIGALFYLVGFNLIFSVKFIVLLANIITIIGSYFLAKKMFKNKWASVLVSAVISLAPYRAVDMSVRTAFSELWAISFLPWVFLGIINVIEKKKNNYILSLSFAFLILSHNLTALMILPFAGAFGLSYLFWIDKKTKINEKFKLLLDLTLKGLLGLGLSAFYFIPALVEKSFTQLDKHILSSYYDYTQHFLYIRQFFKPWGEWEFGGSGWGPNDEMSFFLGFGQLAVLIIAIFLVAIPLLKKDKIIHKNIFKLQVVILSLTGISLFLSLLKAKRLWDLFTFTSYFQFPWRFLAISLVFIGILAGGIYMLVDAKKRSVYFGLIFLLLIGLNWRYFQNNHYIKLNVKSKDLASEIRLKRSGNLYDYIPKDINFYNKDYYTLVKNPEFKDIKVPANIFVSNNLINIKILENKSTKKIFEVENEEEKNLVLNIAYYPGWKAKINDKEFNLRANENGLIEIPLEIGLNKIEVWLGDTPIRFWSKLVSLISWLILLFSLSKYKRQFRH